MSANAGLLKLRELIRDAVARSGGVEAFKEEYLTMKLTRSRDANAEKRFGFHVLYSLDDIDFIIASLVNRWGKEKGAREGMFPLLSDIISSELGEVPVRADQKNAFRSLSSSNGAARALSKGEKRGTKKLESLIGDVLAHNGGLEGFIDAYKKERLGIKCYFADPLGQFLLHLFHSIEDKDFVMTSYDEVYAFHDDPHAAVLDVIKPHILQLIGEPGNVEAHLSHTAQDAQTSRILALEWT